ncbi:MAG: lysophospholipid acyltransferase family protein [Candidatus Omnitrophica bacterium]|nr:lysophospholipid acyltransferase family protein [Candidatus Omnitrophota bacterium]
MAKRKLYRFPLYLLVRLTAGFAGLLPRSVLSMVAHAVGQIGYRVISRQRRKIFENLRRVYGFKKSDKELHRMGSDVMKNFALTGLDILKFPHLTASKVDRFVSTDETLGVYDDLLREGMGILSITAHLGNWELLAGFFGLHGYRGAVVGRRIYYEPYNRWIVGLRKAVGVRTIYRDGSAKEILRLLRRNEVVGLLPDQDIDSVEGLFVPFLGKEAYTPIAPVRLALVSGAPILVNFLVREPGNRYRVVIGKVIRPVVETTRQEAVFKYTAMWVKEFERVIQMYPEQWAWMHDRWKTMPQDVQKKRKESFIAL